eukprot:7370925-Prymnesium_polylepis.1
MRRSEAQPSPAASAHAACQPANELSILLDPARLSQRARPADRPVCSPAACDADGAGERR